MGLKINMVTSKNPEEALVAALLKPADMTTYTTVRDILKPIFKLGFYDVCMAVKGNLYSATLPVTLSNILKGGASEQQRNLCRSKLLAMFNNALTDAGVGVPSAPIPAVDMAGAIYNKTIPGMPKIGEIEAIADKKLKKQDGAIDMLLASLKGEQAVSSKVTGNQLPPPLNNAPVSLKEAVAIGQPVRGSSLGSVYYTVAMSERVKLAIRVQNDTVSVRAEGNFAGIDAKKMQAFGMTQGSSGKYFSMHVHCAGVPVPRVVGAILMGLGIDFDQQVTNFKQIKVTS